MRRGIVVLFALIITLALTAFLVRWPQADAAQRCQECRLRFCCTTSAHGWKDCEARGWDVRRGECMSCKVHGGPCPD